MKKYTLFISLFLFITATTIAQKQLSINPVIVNPHPGGSPFPPGGAPSLTHTVKAFWTTQDGLITTIKIKADGDRATQLSCFKWNGEKKININNSISPDCEYHIMITPSKMEITEGVYNVALNGYGEIEVRVFGFRQEDFNNPPVMTVLYTRNGKEIAMTTVKAHPVPEKFKSKSEDVQNKKSGETMDGEAIEKVTK